jgi:hypothetical protein
VIWNHESARAGVALFGGRSTVTGSDIGRRDLLHGRLVWRAAGVFSVDLRRADPAAELAEPELGCWASQQTHGSADMNPESSMLSLPGLALVGARHRHQERVRAERVFRNLCGAVSDRQASRDLHRQGADFGTFAPVIRELGKRHARYGTRQEHYAVVADALLWSLAKGLGVAFVPEVRSAWAKVYSLLVKTM